MLYLYELLHDNLRCYFIIFIIVKPTSFEAKLALSPGL